MTNINVYKNLDNKTLMHLLKSRGLRWRDTRKDMIEKLQNVPLNIKKDTDYIIHLIGNYEIYVDYHSMKSILDDGYNRETAELVAFSLSERV